MAIGTEGIRRLGRGLVAAVAATATMAAPASGAPAPAPRTDARGVGLRLLDAPVTAREDPRARLYIVDHLAPGTAINRRIEVTNTTASAVHVTLYAAAATIAGGSFLGADGRTANDLSTWTSVHPATSDVPAGGRMTGTVTIAVPRDAAPGEQLGVVWAETRAAPAAGTGLTAVNRVGIRLYVSVGAGGPPAADFAIDSLTATRGSDGRPTVVATVHNTGGRALDMSGTLQLRSGPAGLNAGPFAADLGTSLAVGDTQPVTIALDERLPAGPWDAHLSLRSGVLDRSARATITFPTTGAASPVGTSSAPPRWLYPAVAALMVLLLGIAIRHARKRRVVQRHRRAGTPKAAAGH